MNSWVKNCGTVGLLLLLLCVSSSCTRDPDLPREELPPARVEYRIDLHHEGLPLQSPFGYLLLFAPTQPYEAVGYCGVVVLHTPLLPSSVGTATFVAYDLLCPACGLLLQNQLEVQDLSPSLPNYPYPSAFCSECGSRYDLAYGTGGLLSTPSSSRQSSPPLIQYQVHPLPDAYHPEWLHIFSY